MVVEEEEGEEVVVEEEVEVLHREGEVEEVEGGADGGEEEKDEEKDVPSGSAISEDEDPENDEDPEKEDGEFKSSVWPSLFRQ